MGSRTMHLKCISIVCFLLLSLSAKSQDHQWWSENVGWDGSRHWREYLIFAPRHLGPNALPIPAMNWGYIEENHALGMSAHMHSMRGDQTFNPKVFGRYVPLPGKISFAVSWVPLEYFRTSHEWKTDRNVFHIFYNDRVATADVLFRTRIQVFAETPKRVGVVARFGFRLPSSSKVGAARFTDAPGYYVDVAAGKSWGSHWRWRTSGMLGLYVWQTNTSQYVQNDAILYGLGVRAEKGRWSMDMVGRGYWGYLNNGDRVAALSCRTTHRWGQYNVFVAYEKGLNDLRYQQGQVGLRWDFKP